MQRGGLYFFAINHNHEAKGHVEENKKASFIKMSESYNRIDHS